MDKNRDWGGGERKETIPFLSDICPSLVRDLFGKTVNRMSEQSTSRSSSLWLSKNETILPSEGRGGNNSRLPFVYTIKELFKKVFWYKPHNFFRKDDLEILNCFADDSYTTLNFINRLKWSLFTKRCGNHSTIYLKF